MATPDSSTMGTKNYFTEFTFRKGALYAFAAFYVLSVSIVAVYEPFVALPCDGVKSNLTFANPLYNGSPCRDVRYARLLYLTREECSYSRRLVSAVVIGGLIGWERREADRPAGIRTMSLVSLGSSLFTICSTFGFLTGPNEWDASRISAAIPSGVGFLGAGLIFKEAKNHEEGGPTHVVHGLTTAASLWLSAAVGIACGGELYFAASFGTAMMLLLLRFGPRNSDLDEDDESDNEQDLEGMEAPMVGLPSVPPLKYGSEGRPPHTERDGLMSDLSSQGRRPQLSQRAKAKSKASLATTV
jgi:putative Mg2+ transporter-C (MgtC) family protein